VGTLVLVGIGGFIGSTLRFLASGYVQQVADSAQFPYGTVVVNLLGCFLIGLLSQLAETRGAFTPEARALVFIGFLGGFTTFSTFGVETMNLLRDGEALLAMTNVSVQVVLGLGAVWIGRALPQMIWR
jgi:CrcB protein